MVEFIYPDSKKATFDNLVNQIKTMNQVVAEEKSSGLLFILAIINFIIAISLFVFTLVIL